MIVQILRTVFIAVAIYLLTKLIKQFIDNKLGPPNNNKDNAVESERSHLVPCPECGVYIANDIDHTCKKNEH